MCILLTKSNGKCQSNIDNKLWFIFFLANRCPTISYCGSEIGESEIYSPYSFCGSEAGTDVAQGDPNDGWSKNQVIYIFYFNILGIFQINFCKLLILERESQQDC